MLGRGLWVGCGGWCLQDDAIILAGPPPKLRVCNNLCNVGLLWQLLCHLYSTINQGNVEIARGRGQQTRGAAAKRGGGAMRGGCACGQVAPALENERGRQKKTTISQQKSGGCKTMWRKSWWMAMGGGGSSGSGGRGAMPKAVGGIWG